MATRIETSIDQLVWHLQHLGVRKNAVVQVHTSFRAVGPVEGGPLGLIAALRRVIGDDGTLVMPTMTNGETIFDPRSTASEGMGITAELFWRVPGVVRSTHPGASFAAQGPMAPWICQSQPLSPPHGIASPVGRVYELGGHILLLGVGHSENTTLHLAESLLPVPYAVEHPCVVERDGLACTVGIAESDHCCRRFCLLDEWLNADNLQRMGQVGSADARLVAACDAVNIALAHLRDDPLVFLCPVDENCDECQLARVSVEMLL